MSQKGADAEKLFATSLRLTVETRARLAAAVAKRRAAGRSVKQGANDSAVVRDLIMAHLPRPQSDSAE